jgi:hypothetical protein
MTDHRTPERPKVEPEIIPPDRPDPWRHDTRRIWPSGRHGHVRFVQFQTGGPLAFLVALLMLGLGVAVVLALLLGLVLLWIPVTLAIAVAILWSLLFRRR